MTSSIIQPAIDAFHQRAPLRVGSLLVTIFGDAVQPHGEFVRLSSLLEITTSIGIDDGAVRVAIHRLEKVGWLKKHKVGRNAHYALSKVGEDESRQAAKLIYGYDRPPDCGQLQMLVLNEGAGRAKTREVLAGAGWAVVAPNILLTSGAKPQLAALRYCADRQNQYLIPMDDQILDVQRLCCLGFELAALNDAYRAYYQLFSPILEGTNAAASPSAKDALILRILMIHDYRQLVLKDPVLAPSCLPKDWHGYQTRELLSKTYQTLKERSKNWMD